MTSSVGPTEGRIYKALADKSTDIMVLCFLYLALSGSWWSLLIPLVWISAMADGMQYMKKKYDGG